MEASISFAVHLEHSLLDTLGNLCERVCALLECAPAMTLF